MTQVAGHAVMEHMSAQSCTLAYFDAGCVHFGLNAMPAVPVDAPGVAVHLHTGSDSGWRHRKDCQNHP